MISLGGWLFWRSGLGFYSPKQSKKDSAPIIGKPTKSRNNFGFNRAAVLAEKVGQAHTQRGGTLLIGVQLGCNVHDFCALNR